MKRLTLVMLALLGGGTLVGCQPPAATVAAAGATLSVRPLVESPAGRVALQTLDPLGYVQADIHHTVLRLYRVDGSDAFPVLSGAQAVEKRIDDLDAETVNFHHLHPHTTYRVKAFAYDASNLLISKESSFVDLAVAASERPTFATLTLYLADKPFDGQATSSFSVRDGGIVNTPDAVNLAFE